jgi:hypothetical protein
MSAVPTPTPLSHAGRPPGLPAPPPRLENGDRLTRAEFERRYHAMPDVTKAELIEGIVYLPSPVRNRRHGRPHVFLTTWIGTYFARTPGLDDVSDNATVRIDGDNEPQPDLLLLLPKRLGGLAENDADNYVNGPPTMVCEIAASSVSLDVHAKLNVYRRNGVREYLVWRTEDRAVDWLALRDGQYEPLPTDPAGVIKSEQFPGLWLDAAALLREDLPALLATHDRRLSGPDHAGFAQRHARRKRPAPAI